MSGSFDCFTDITREQYFALNSKGETFIDSLSKYGTRYQTDLNTAQNSRSGDMEMVEISTPEIPQAEPWSSLEKLNKERDLVGIYLLSDNMRLGSTVAASGTAQVVSAANSYHREGDTNITQNFYNGHDTAAAQQREARWEADKAKARKR